MINYMFRVEIIDKVNSFLDFLKSGNFNLDFVTRSTNKQTMFDLNISFNELIDEIHSLTLENFSKILKEDNSYFDCSQPIFVFGKTIQNKEIYIKLKRRDNYLIVLSFHVSKYKMYYPFD